LGVDLTPLIEYARRHHQLVDREAAEAMGMTRRAWYWAIESNRIEQLHPGVARLAGAVDTPEQRILAAVLACGQGTMASHRSAAHLWCPDDRPPSAVDVIVARARHGRTLPRVCVHRPTDVGDLRPAFRANIPVTNPLRTLVDLGAVDADGVRSFLERVVVAGFATPAVVTALLERHRGRGRAGVAALDAALRDWTMNDKPPDSVLEEAMNALLLRFGLPRVTFHALLAGHEVDFLVLDSPIVIECDGWATHGLLREKFEHDRERDAHLTAAGFVVLRVTWRQVRRRPATVAARVRAVIARFAPHLLVLGPP
jgi:very-short-patch-repair endonuclease